MWELYKAGSAKLYSELNTNPALQTNIEHYFSLDDTHTSGSISQDIEGDINLTINGATTGATGVINESYTFDGGSDELESSSTEIAEFGSDDFTMSMWVNTTASGFKVIASKANSDVSKSWLLVHDAVADGLTFYSSSDGTSFTQGDSD